MKRLCTVLGLLLASSGISRADRTVTLTGWFSDLSCASGRAKSGVFTQTNPDCAKRCIEEGAPAAFISATEKAVFQVKDYSSVVADLGYQVEVVGAIDDAGKTITVKSVRRLSSYQGPSCSRPVKK
jgi:hypothetical protein